MLKSNSPRAQINYFHGIIYDMSEVVQEKLHGLHKLYNLRDQQQAKERVCCEENDPTRANSSSGYSLGKYRENGILRDLVTLTPT